MVPLKSKSFAPYPLPKTGKEEQKHQKEAPYHIPYIFSYCSLACSSSYSSSPSSPSKNLVARLKRAPKQSQAHLERPFYPSPYPFPLPNLSSYLIPITYPLLLHPSSFPFPSSPPLSSLMLLRLSPFPSPVPIPLRLPSHRAATPPVPRNCNISTISFDKETVTRAEVSLCRRENAKTFLLSATPRREGGREEGRKRK